MQKNKKTELKKLKDDVEKKATLLSFKISLLKNLGATQKDLENIIDKNLMAKEDELNEKIENAENFTIDEKISLYQEYLGALEETEKKLGELHKKLKKK